ncbi:SDR family NAD(P)-dependent oxidoreductase [Propionicicella superfundia]|uniref:SDR family NAD(P)-dependent oxidoreductase n=1 Tax=Propionicicella superfundia TaxID=348582 RepID=UPI0004916265|nr:SDR family NAD(P)-dependent oxidoreductase [Propionicicella superfundia]
MSWALITGGTSGIGAAYARHLASQGYDLVLVARDTARLRDSATELTETFGIEVETISADLAVRTDVDTVAARLETGERPIDLFINNAGFGLKSKLLDADTTEHERAFDVMIRAVLVLGGAAGRGMKVRGHGRIANTGSMSSWISQGNYSAIKAWVTTYSESLRNELAGTGVTVTNISPGWVRTEFHTRAGIRNSLPGWAWVDADTMARLSLGDILKGRPQSVPTAMWKLGTFFVRHAPRSVIRLISRALVRSRE